MTVPRYFPRSPIPPQVKGSESFFASCERDEEGHCKPSGEAGEKKPEKKPASGEKPVPPKFDPKAVAQALSQRTKEEIIAELERGADDRAARIGVEAGAGKLRQLERMDRRERSNLIADALLSGGGHKESKPASANKPKAFGDWGSFEQMARQIRATPEEYVVLRAGQINSDTPNFFSIDPGTAESYGMKEGREVNLWQLDPSQIAFIGRDNFLDLDEDEEEELEMMGAELFSDPPQWFLDKLEENGYSGYTDGQWVRTQDSSAIEGKFTPSGVKPLQKK